MKVYTKTGDKGETSLIGGVRIEKDDIRIESYGTVDELNSFVGLLSDRTNKQLNLKSVSIQLAQVQHYLFVVGSNLATSKESKTSSIPKLDENQIEFLEKCIDDFERELPVMTNFILPGGDELISLAHCCRTICRRAERRVVALQTNPDIVKYLNRLSDYFFVLARYVALKLEKDEIKWIPKK
jgi:cob(I)alamin adenosyltransferase